MPATGSSASPSISMRVGKSGVTVMRLVTSRKLGPVQSDTASLGHSRHFVARAIAHGGQELIDAGGWKSWPLLLVPQVRGSITEMRTHPRGGVWVVRIER